MVYECIKGFRANLVDEDGSMKKQAGCHVEKGSMWKTDADAVNVTGSDIHLEELTGASWMELSRERLSTHFREID